MNERLLLLLVINDNVYTNQIIREWITCSWLFCSWPVAVFKRNENLWQLGREKKGGEKGDKERKGGPSGEKKKRKAWVGEGKERKVWEKQEKERPEWGERKGDLSREEKEKKNCSEKREKIFKHALKISIQNTDFYLGKHKPLLFVENTNCSQLQSTLALF